MEEVCNEGDDRGTHGCSMDLFIILTLEEVTIDDRFRQHPRALSPINQQSKTTEHQMDLKCIAIIDMEAQGATRMIKEAMYILVNDPYLNRNLGKCNLPNLWDKVLEDNPSLQLK